MSRERTQARLCPSRAVGVPLNGRELVSTGDNRSVEFDQYPSELINGVTVYKTPDAGLVGQGLSGTLDMKTARPLSFGDGVAAVSLRGQRNSLGAAADAEAGGVPGERDALGRDQAVVDGAEARPGGVVAVVGVLRVGRVVADLERVEVTLQLVWV